MDESQELKKINKKLDDLRKEIKIIYKTTIECNRFDSIYRIRDNFEKTDKIFADFSDGITSLFMQVFLIFLSIFLGIAISLKKYDLMFLIIFLLLISFILSIILIEKSKNKFKRSKEYQNLKKIEKALLSGNAKEMFKT
ncbi:MAG: hypothetical protein BWY36_00677 [Candidatus Diapherotrites archaeon ADurb.Bin253]|nr:MAG: hypothetical protein BWY36_00677 [Candidatus Diapherotrites archaeon ADurb.Bin253]